jgi:rfaE bifunctional protein nucleotidyltransferase chain/domain
MLCAQPYTTPERLARSLVRDLDVEAVALTLGGSGAALARRSGRFARIPSPTLVTAGDTCGAGDRFAASVAVALVDGSSIEDAVVMAVGEATRFVEQGGAAAIRVPEPASSAPISSLIVSAAASSLSRPFSGVCEQRASTDPAFDVASRIRKSGGRLIATGGCFDLLHAGHVSLLRRARALGDLLIVCVNSDESIRRLKGPNRPVVAQQDRVEVLRALGCVDAVVLFEKDDPSELIERLRPDVWVKGGDYAARALPEAAAVHQVGGEIVVLPSLPGYSTTGLIAAIQAS